MPIKAWQDEMKAEPLSTERLDLWLQGRIPRRALVIPFTGPLPGGKAGLDLDGEFFDEDTDLYGNFDVLRRTRERMVDWHHDNDPTGKMKGAILGRVVLDQDPVAGEGLWADFWANAGEKRRDLLARLESAGIPLYGSSEPVQSGVKKGKGGHIDTWPIVRHTVTTSPQNTHAVVPALKALLDEAKEYDALTVAALQAAAVGGTDSPLRTLAAMPGERAGKADSLTRPQAARLEALMDDLRRIVVQ